MADIDTITTNIPADSTVVETEVEKTEPTIEGDEGKVESGVEDDTKQEKAKRQSRLDRRFSELTNKVRSAGMDAQTWRETLTEATGKEPPDRADYADQEDYFSAIEDYREAIRGPKTMLQQAEREEQKAHTELQDTLMEKWDDKVAELNIPNFQAIVSKADLPISTTLQNAILKHKDGPRIVYYLATHIETARELVSLPIEEQILELSEIASKKVQAGRNVVPVEDEEDDSPALPPSRSVKAEVQTVKLKPESMSLEQFTKWRKAGGGK